MIIELIGGPSDGHTVHKYTKTPPPHHDLVLPVHWSPGAMGGTSAMQRHRYVRTDTHNELGHRRYVYEPMVNR